MAIKVTEPAGGKAIEVQVSGKLRHEDYRDFVPRVEERLKANGKVRVLFEMADFHGWDPSAWWDELKFDVQHYADVERFAMVGEKRWERTLSAVSRPFTTARVRYFDRAEIAAAREWLEET